MGRSQACRTLEDHFITRPAKVTSCATSEHEFPAIIAYGLHFTFKVGVAWGLDAVLPVLFNAQLVSKGDERD